MKLNKQQDIAVRNSYDNDIVLMAGAGSGKTRVLVERVDYILRNELATADELLVLTFTKKAANEMTERLKKMGHDVSNFYCGTFHSIFSKFLRKYGNLIGTMKSNFIIMNDNDCKNIIKKILEANNISYESDEIGYYKSCISNFKNSLLSPTKAISIAQSSGNTQKIKEAQIYKAYHIVCWKTNRFDFDDLLVYQYVLMDENPNIKSKLQNMFKYILVDEAQDCNRAQIVILQQFKTENNNLMLIGDIDQSIYAFRGARPDFMLNHKKYFDNSKVMLLEQNYRSTKNIINSSNCVIKNNKNRIVKNVFTENQDGELIKIYRYANSEDEAENVVAIINLMVSLNNYSYKDFVILYRNRYLSRAFEQVLNNHSIPYKIIGSVKFWERKEIANLLAFFKLARNPKDKKSFIRVLKQFKGVGEKKIDNIINQSKELDVDYIEMLKYCNYNKSEYSKFPELYEILTKYIDLYDLADKVIDLLELLEKYTKIDAEWSKEILEYLNEFLTIARENRDIGLVEFLDTITLSSSIDEKTNNCVNLMTVHMSKGLEFPVVFIIGCEDGIFPSLRTSGNENIEEERRLMYVAMTRAMDMLFITSCQERQYKFFNKSRFIKEIDDKYTEKIDFVMEDE